MERSELPLYDGQLHVKDGKITENISLIHARSLAEDVHISIDEDQAFNGVLNVEDGSIQETELIIEGRSLVHSAKLTTIAFRKGFFGNWGQYIVSIGLLLFAFSTAISWSYYGDRAMTYLLGSRSVVYYRIVYVGAFFFAAFTDTAIIWTVANIAIVLMTIPNLIGILLLSKDMKGSIKTYWEDFKKEHPDEKTIG